MLKRTPALSNFSPKLIILHTRAFVSIHANLASVATIRSIFATDCHFHTHPGHNHTHSHQNYTYPNQNHTRPVHNYGHHHSRTPSKVPFL